MANKKKKREFGYFYSMSPNAGNVEYNNKVFNSMMMPGGGESSQGDSQAMSEEINQDDTVTIRRNIIYDKLPGRDYFSKVKGLAQNIINYLKKNPENTYDFVLDEKSFAERGVVPETFHNDLIDFLRAEDPDRYSMLATLRSYRDEPTMFDYDYSVYDDLARYSELREAQWKALPVGEATFISKPQRYGDLDTFKAKLIMNPMTRPERYKAKVSYATDVKSFDDLDRVVKETHFKGGWDPKNQVIKALEVLSSDGTYLVDPEGYDYARYVAFIPKEIKEDMKENLKESVDEYKITSMEDMLDGMPDNTDDETIDTTLKVFRKVSSHLGTHKKDIVVLVTDPATEYDPKNSDIKFEVEEIPHRFKQSSLHTYKTPDYEFIREQVYPANMVFLYFKNEGDKDQYLNDVYGAGGVQEEGLKEDTEAPFTYQLYDEEYIFDKITGNLRVLASEAVPTTPGTLVNFIFLDHDESKKHPYRFIRKSRGRFPYEFEEVSESLDEKSEETLNEDADEEDKPFTYREVYDELKREGDLKKPSGKIHYGFESEAKAAHKIISRKHKNCDYYLIPDPMIKGAEQWEVVWDDKIEKPLNEDRNDIGDRSMADIKLEESLTESALVDKGDTYSQREIIRIIEEIAKDLGIKVHYGTKTGKVPQTVILDYKPQDNAISINPDGSLEIGEIELGNRAKKQDIAQALHSLLELNEKLIQSDSDKALQKNIETEIKAGKDPKQAAAIAYSVQEKNKKKEESLKTYAGDPVTPEDVEQEWERVEKAIKELKPGQSLAINNQIETNGFALRNVERLTDNPDEYTIYDENSEGISYGIDRCNLNDALHYAKEAFNSLVIDDEPAENFLDF